MKICTKVRRVLSDWTMTATQEAAYQLAMRYENGAYGVTQDNAQALLWYRKAADQGSTQAMSSLAEIYAKGLLGVQADPAMAQQWLSRRVRH